MIHSLGSGTTFGAGDIVGIIVIPLVLALFLAWYARYTLGRGRIA